MPDHKPTLKQLCIAMATAFTAHPQQTGETYFQHLWFTARMALRFLHTSSVIMLHGVFPFLCTRTASDQIEGIYRIMKTRIPKKRREEIDKETTFITRIPAEGGNTPTVAVIGGGFSGALVLANLVRQTQGPLAVEWFEEDDVLGTGVAYGTGDSAHLLNVRAERMGAFSGKVDGFYHWLQSEEGKAQVNKHCRGQEFTGESFVPRIVYGEYLRHIVKDALAQAKDKGITVRTHHAPVIDARLQDADAQQVLLAVDRGKVQEEMVVDAVVLATGNLAPRSFHFQAGLISGRHKYVADVWNTGQDNIFPQRVGELPPDTEIVIIGTGLTMVDTVLTLRSRGYKGIITAISRNGWLPLAHAHSKPYPAWEWVYAPQFAPKSAFGLFTRLREEVARAESQGHDWRSVVDSLRPATQTLWKQMNVTEKRRFMDKLFTLWNIHRHRMSPDIHAELKALQKDGVLRIIAGKIYYVGSDKDGLTVAYRKRGTNRVDTLRPALVLNCTGPEYDIAVSDHKLLRKLRDRELIAEGPLRIGIETTEGGTARGKAPDAIFPIGTLLMGELLECTAVPELREQAHQIAGQVLSRLQLMYEQDHRARLAMGAWI